MKVTLPGHIETSFCTGGRAVQKAEKIPGVDIKIQYDFANNGPFVSLATGVDDGLLTYDVTLDKTMSSDHAVLRWS
ncbi:hypothetical protein HDU76_003567 [Blyttiomyces sp. JEL0837]|nr:hypothetical protein HDU76_003567 [Blyttiomyces sp. JEL0837]